MKTKRERLQAGLAFALGLLTPTLALASAATPVAPCVTVLSTTSGVTQEFCVPVTAGAPLPVTVTGGGGGGTASNFDATFPTSGTAAGAEYLSSPPTLTSGQMVPFFVDASGNLNVNIKAGGGSGGTAIADETAFTYGTTVFTPVGGVYNSSITGLTSGQAGALALTSDRNAFANINRWVGTQLGAPSNYGTSPGAVEVPGVNAFVTNTVPVTGTFFQATQPVSGTFWQTTQPVSVTVAATGGASTTGNIAANNTTAVVVKGSPGTLYGVQLAGLGSAPAYLKLYNATSATCGSGTPVKRLIIPAASTAANGAGSNISFGPQGVAFGTGITYCVTTGITDADATAPAASTFLVNIDWN